MQGGREGAGTLCALVPGLSFVFHLFLSPAQQGGCGREKTSVRLWGSSGRQVTSSPVLVGLAKAHPALEKPTTSLGLFSELCKKFTVCLIPGVSRGTPCSL